MTCAEDRKTTMLAVFQRALEELLERLGGRDGLSKAGEIGTRNVPKRLKREIWVRDEGRCTFVRNGRRCVETRWLEIDHIIPFAMGGQAELANLRLLCRAHNQLSARRIFGHLDYP